MVHSIAQRLTIKVDYMDYSDFEDTEDILNEGDIGRYVCECGDRTDNKNGICDHCAFIKTIDIDVEYELE